MFNMENNNEITTNDLIAAERMVILQNFAETFMVKHGIASTGEVFKSDDVYGYMSEEQARLLRSYLKEDLEAYGLNLEYYVTSRGEQYEAGKLSKSEIALLMRKADDMILFLDTLQKRKQRMQEKE